MKPVMDSVQEQMEGMAEVHPSIMVYRNEDTDRSNVVATRPVRAKGNPRKASRSYEGSGLYGCI